MQTPDPALLDRFPRAPLGHWPTPLERTPRLARAAGADEVFVKRDDINGFAGGGNKLRKLEYLLAAAVADGADTVITSGALQTNHGRQTAAACARLGLRCELVLTRAVPREQAEYEESGNVLLDRLFGARLHTCADADSAERTVRTLVREAAAEGRTAAVLPVGGSNALGTLGYASAAGELFAQLDAAGIPSAHVVAPLGSAGTAAGLLLGAQLHGWPGSFEFPSVLAPAGAAGAELVRLVAAGAELLDVPTPLPSPPRSSPRSSGPLGDRVCVHDRTLGPGYGQPTDEMWRALEVFATEEGIALDPVYTGKAAAALLSRPPAPGVPVVFLHTGGLPGLFAYAGDLRDHLGRARP